MPYIEGLDKRIKLLPLLDPENSGELNYCVTMICKGYLDRKKESYQTYNDIIGALESAKLELYARKIRPYEEKKIKDNGDVY